MDRTWGSFPPLLCSPGRADKVPGPSPLEASMFYLTEKRDKVHWCCYLSTLLKSNIYNLNNTERKITTIYVLAAWNEGWLVYSPIYQLVVYWWHNVPILRPNAELLFAVDPNPTVFRAYSYLLNAQKTYVVQRIKPGQLCIKQAPSLLYCLFGRKVDSFTSREWCSGRAFSLYALT